MSASTAADKCERLQLGVSTAARAIFDAMAQPVRPGSAEPARPNEPRARNVDQAPSADLLEARVLVMDQQGGRIQGSS